MNAGLDVPTVLALVVALGAAVNQFRLTRANRTKVVSEGARDAAQGSDFITQGAARLVEHWEQENGRLRERVAVLEHRIDQLEGLMHEHGVPIPAD